MKSGNTSLTAPEEEDDFSRKVYCLLGIPVDDITMDCLVGRIAKATTSRSRLFISTPNLNFLILSQHDPEFRRSLLVSDICSVDGIGVLLLCRLLGVPIKSRVAGSDIPNAILVSPRRIVDRPISMVFFGGGPGVGELARKAVNAGDTERLICVAAIDPGVMNSKKMSDVTMLESVNATGADFLLVALGAQKGQAWLLRSLNEFKIPVVSHLGATLNFLAGTVQRAPIVVRQLGLEWLWRIKEEPRLASRYISDGAQLVWLMLSRIIPLGCWLRWNKICYKNINPSVQVITDDSDCTKIIVEGAAPNNSLDSVAMAFRSALLLGNSILLDLRGLCFFEMGFTGYIIMMEKSAQKQNQSFAIVGATSDVTRVLTWCGLKHLIKKCD